MSQFLGRLISSESPRRGKGSGPLEEERGSEVLKENKHFVCLFVCLFVFLHCFVLVNITMYLAGGYVSP